MTNLRRRLLARQDSSCRFSPVLNNYFMALLREKVRVFVRNWLVSSCRDIGKVKLPFRTPALLVRQHFLSNCFGSLYHSRLALRESDERQTRHDND